MKKILLTIALSGALGIYTLQAQTQQSPATTQQADTLQNREGNDPNMATFPTDTTMDSPMRQDDQQNMQNTPENRRQPGRNTQQQDPQGTGTGDINRSQQGMNRSGVGAGNAQQSGYGEEDGIARESLNPDSDFRKTEENTIRYNEPIERGNARVPRAQDNMRQGTQRQGTGTGTTGTQGRGQGAVQNQNQDTNRDTLNNNQNRDMRDSDDQQRTTIEPSRTTDPNRTRQPAGSTDPGTRTTTPPRK